MSNEKREKMETASFPKMIEKPELGAMTPIQLLTLHLNTIIDIITGKVFLDALPLIGGEEAQEELASWKLGVQAGNDDVFSNKKQISTYMTVALGAFSMGQAAAAHVNKSHADATKAIFELASCYDRVRPDILEVKKTIKSKDLNPEEKLDLLWTVCDTLYESFKERVNNNAKAYPENLKALVDDLMITFTKLDQLTEGAKYIGIIKPEQTKNNSNI